MSTHALKIREQSGQSLQWLLSGSEALQLFSGYCRCHIASNIVEYKVISTTESFREQMMLHKILKRLQQPSL